MRVFRFTFAGLAVVLALALAACLAALYLFGPSNLLNFAGGALAGIYAYARYGVAPDRTPGAQERHAPAAPLASMTAGYDALASASHSAPPARV